MTGAALDDRPASQSGTSTSSTPPPRSASQSAGITTIAGALSGAFARLVIGPLDVVKIRFQVQLEPIGALSSSSSKAFVQPPGKYSGIWQCMTTIAKEEGIAGLWRGTIPGQLLTIPYCAIQFTVLQQLKDLARSSGYMQADQRHAPLVSLVSGAVAGVAATMGSYPFDLLRTTLAAQGEPRVYRNMADAARGIIAADGVRGLYRGLGTTIAEIVPYSALQFGVYDGLNWLATEGRRRVEGKTMDKHARRNGGDGGGDSFSEQAPPWQQFVCGFCAGLVAKLATHPLDTIKKRYQVAGLRRDLRYGQRVDASTASLPFVQLAWRVLRTEGIRGLYKGALPNLIKAAPNSAVTFVVYEYLLGVLSASALFRDEADHAKSKRSLP